MTHALRIKKTMYPAMMLAALITAGCDSSSKGIAPEGNKQAAENNASRVSFDQLFDVSGNNVTPRKIIRYSGKTFTPEVPFDSSVVILDGTPFTQLIGHDAEIKKAGDVTEIVRFY